MLDRFEVMSMKKNILFVLLFVFAFLFSFDSVEALDDSGFVACNYYANVSIDGKNVVFDARVGVANAADQYLFYQPAVSLLKHKLNALDSDTFSAFHPAKSNNYSCPSVRFVLMDTKNENQVPSGCILPNGNPCEPQNTDIYYFSVVTNSVYKNSSKYKDKPVSDLLSANDSMSNNGDNVKAEEHCSWNIESIIKFANLSGSGPWNADNIKPDNSTYMTCYSVSNETLVDRIVAAFGFKKDDDYSDVIENGDVSCVSLLGDDNVELISTGFLVISIIGIILLIVLVATDFVKAVAASDDDENKKAFKNFKIRLISIVILLLLPVLVNFVLNFVDDHLYLETVNSKGEKTGESSIKFGNVKDCGLLSNE